MAAQQDSLPPIITTLLERGVVMPNPGTVTVDASVLPERIASGVVLHPGTRLAGADLSIGPGSSVGAEAPAVLENCRLGHDVSLHGGFFQESVFLDGSAMGSGAHVRPGTLLEEQARAAQTVGFKQTLLMPYAVAGSLINFCDALLAGGTSEKNHSEIGSSYVHFNFTPRGDKATASLFGDVPRGVMLDQRPVFLGGQGGTVGPARVGFGSVIPAGRVFRGEDDEGGQLLAGEPLQPGREGRAFDPRCYGLMDAIVRRNLVYLGNILALKAWYSEARSGFMGSDPFRRACYEGALIVLNIILHERVARLEDLAERLPESIAVLGGEGKAAKAQKHFLQAWPGIKGGLEELMDAPGAVASAEKDSVLVGLEIAAGGGRSYLDSVHTLNAEAKAAGTRWLSGIVDTVVGLWHA